MTRVELLYLLPYFLSLTLSIGIFYYTWRRRKAKGAMAFTWHIAGQTLWIFGFIIELITPDLYGKIFWDGFQWLAGTAILVIFPVFVVQFIEYKIANPRRVFALSLIVPAIFVLILMTDSYHHLIYPNPYLSFGFPFFELSYDFTWVIIGFALYCYLIMFWGLGLLIRSFFRLHSLYRS